MGDENDNEVVIEFRASADGSSFIKIKKFLEGQLADLAKQFKHLEMQINGMSLETSKAHSSRMQSYEKLREQLKKMSKDEKQYSNDVKKANVEIAREFEATQRERVRIASAMHADLVRLKREEARAFERAEREKTSIANREGRERERYFAREIQLQKQGLHEAILLQRRRNAEAAVANRPATFFERTGFSRQVASFALVAGAYKAGDWLTDLVEGAQKVRDLKSNMEALSSTTQKAAENWAYFTKAQNQTKASALQLIEAYNQLLPQLKSRGFSEDAARAFTVQLSRMASIGHRRYDRTFDSMFEDLQKDALTAFTGKIQGGANTFLQMIGVSRHDINKVGIEGMLDKTQKVAKEYEKVGDDFQSVNRKIADSFKMAFGEGWEQVRDEAMKGVISMLQTLTKPDVLNAFVNLAIGMGNAISFIGNNVNNVIATFELFAGTAYKIFAALYQFLTNTIGRGIYQLAENQLNILLKIITTINSFVQKLVNSPLGKVIAAAMPGVDYAQIKGTAKEFSAYVTEFEGVVKRFKAAKDEAIKENNIFIGAIRDQSRELLKSAMDRFYGGGGNGVFDGQGANLAIPDKGSPYPGLYLDKSGAGAKSKRTTAQRQAEEWLNQIRAEIEVLSMMNQKAASDGLAFKGNLQAAFGDYQVELAKNASEYSKASDKFDRLAKILGIDSRILQEINTELTKMRNLADAVAETDIWSKILGKSLDEGTDIAKAWSKDLERQYKFERSQTDIRIKTGIAEDKDRAKEQARALREAMRDYRVFENLAADFIQGITQGADGFGQAAANSFNRMANEGFKFLVDSFVMMLGGISQNPDGTYSVKGVEGDIGTLSDAIAASPNRKRIQYGAAAVQAVQIGIGSYANAKSNYQGSMTAGLVGGAASGAAIGAQIAQVAGAVVGAIIGAIAGYVGAALSKADTRDQYKYGVFGIGKTGQVYGTQFRNLQPAEIKEMSARVQDAFDTFWNTYANIIIKHSNFAKDLVPKIKQIDGKFQESASANYLKHFDQFVSITLPDTIAAMFKSGLGKVAVELGMSQKKFDQLWDKFSVLDPKKRAALISTIFDTLQTFKTAIEFLTGVPVTSGDPSSVRRRGIGRNADINSSRIAFNQLNDEYNENIFDKMRRSNTEIIAVAEGMALLTDGSEAQIQAAKELSDLMVQRMETEKEYMLELIQLSEDITASYKDLRSEWTAEGYKMPDGSPDVMAQSRYWQDQAEGVLAGMKIETDPVKLRQMWDQYLTFISRVKDLQSELGPNNAEAARKWGIDALDIGYKIFTDRIKQLGESFDEVNDDLMEKVRPIIANFTHLINTASTGLGGLVPPVEELIPVLIDVNAGFVALQPSLANFGGALDALTEKINNIGFGSGQDIESDKNIQSANIVASRY